MKSKWVTIIVPIYNAEVYLERCISSILAQTYTDLEILLVNDGSTSDRSLEICEQWAEKDPRIKIVNQENAGVSAARNTGLKIAGGEWVMFVDSDDYMFPEMCRMMVDTLLSRDADCVICGTQETGGGFWKPLENRDYDSLSAFRNDFVSQLSTELLSPPWNKIYKKEKINSSFPVNVSFGEDLIFNLNYLKNCKRISFLAEAPFFHEKSNENSWVVKVDKNRLLDIEMVLEAVLDFAKDSKEQGVYNKYGRDLSVYACQILDCLSIAMKEKREIFRRWRKVSYIEEISVWKMQISWQNRIFLFLLKHKCWILYKWIH